MCQKFTCYAFAECLFIVSSGGGGSNSEQIELAVMNPRELHAGDPPITPSQSVPVSIVSHIKSSTDERHKKLSKSTRAALAGTQFQAGSLPFPNRGPLCYYAIIFYDSDAV